MEIANTHPSSSILCCDSLSISCTSAASDACRFGIETVRLDGTPLPLSNERTSRNFSGHAIEEKKAADRCEEPGIDERTTDAEEEDDDAAEFECEPECEAECECECDGLEFAECDGGSELELNASSRTLRLRS